jgi:siroheme synthase
MAAALIASRKSPATPVALVENASLPTQRSRFTTLAGLLGQARPPSSAPTVILYGPQFRLTAGTGWVGFRGAARESCACRALVR